MKKIIERPEEFKQVCVWPATIVGEEHKDEFIQWLKDTFGVRGFYLEDIETLPDKNDITGESGERNDVIFAIHNDDISKFTLPRLRAGIRWIEDVFGNMDLNDNVYYPEYLREYCTWDFGISNEQADEIIKAKSN